MEVTGPGCPRAAWLCSTARTSTTCLRPRYSPQNLSAFASTVPYGLIRLGLSHFVEHVTGTLETPCLLFLHGGLQLIVTQRVIFSASSSSTSVRKELKRDRLQGAAAPLLPLQRKELAHFVEHLTGTLLV